MKYLLLLYICMVVVNALPQKNLRNVGTRIEEAELINVLDEYNTEAIALCHANSLARWDVQTNIGDVELQQVQQNVTIEYAAFRQNFYETVLVDVIESELTDPRVIRQVKFLKELGTAALDDTDLRQFTQTISDMSAIYNTATICPYTSQTCADPQLTLDPEMEEIMAQSEDYGELLYVWTEWRNASGKLMRDEYRTYVELMNKAAVLNGFDDASLWWQDRYEVEGFTEMVDDLWEQVKPLYNELHAYVRLKLLDIYGDDMDRSDPNIPAHLLGNMWAQSWGNLYDRIKPFPDASVLDVTASMISQNYTALKMFEMSDDFYQSMGLESNEMCYDVSRGAIIEKPTDRIIACHASAWDFCDGEDFRVKMCTNVNMVDFKTVHHEMGHIQYFLQYRHLPLALRGAANPGFHEAVGDTIALSVSTPKHLKAINLLDENYVGSEEDDINALFQMALSTVAFLPFGLLIDKWRWDVFNGNVGEDQWNSHWWELRKQYQKISPPIERTEDDFDPGAKYHIPANSQYIAYFIAHLIEFQMYRALCIEAGEYNPDGSTDPLHKCDFFNSVEAGDKLKAGLEMGISEHWEVALEAITGERSINGGAILEYFQPLRIYLREQYETAIRTRLADLEENQQAQCNKLQLAEWAVATDINNETTTANLIQTVAEYGIFIKEQYEQNIVDLIGVEFEDESIQRQVKLLSNLGTFILDDVRLNNLSNVRNNMETIYNNAKVCPYTQQDCDVETEGMELEPDITAIMAESTDYEELKYVWHEWHENTGTFMLSDYQQYVELVNQAAVENGFEDYSQLLMSDYEYDDLISSMIDIWGTVEPLYDELHKYVRNKLLRIYGNDMDKDDELIPAHLLGNMWAQSWVNLYERIKPFPDASDIDVTAAMEANGYTVMDMFEESNRFYLGLGLENNNMSYTGDAIIIKPEDRTIVCHASAWDFCDGVDFRIKQCTDINMVDFVTVHHEMGHIQYYILYKDQPQVFRAGANPGFHEAVGDLIALSVSTPTHLQKIGLLENYEDSEADNINALFKMALERVAFLPFGLLIDLYRYSIFNGSIPPEQWNSAWEQLREEFQKIRSPVERTNENFDAGAKFHVPSGYQYMNYFIAHILEFQLHKAVCIEADEYDPANPLEKPLHKCDIDGSTAAGDKLRAGLELGLSKHWSESLELMTGDTELKADALLEYFSPLLEFLRQENSVEAQLRIQLAEYNEEAVNYCKNSVTANWNVQTNDETEELLQAQQNAAVEYGNFRQEFYTNVWQSVNEGELTDSHVIRQIKFLKELGTAALEEADLRQFTQTVSLMSGIYNTAKICPFSNQTCGDPQLTLDPEIEEIMAHSDDYDELLYAWTTWRSVSGKRMRNDYKTYVELMNKAAVLNGFDDASIWWQDRYEVEGFTEMVDDLWEQVKPLYDELHTYVRSKLLDIYGDKMDRSNPNIPAHLLGNMWAQSWGNLYDRIKPYPDASVLDVTANMIAQNYTALKMFEMSDDFYQSMGLESNEMCYDVSRGAIIEKPTDRTITCHASAWDFCDGEDFRVKMCTNINMGDFKTVHHEMGHIQYYLQYRHLPLALRGGANPGFHEAVGDTIALSVSTPKHLKAINLLDENYVGSEEDDINALFQMALSSVAFLPFGLLIDKWRWDVFNGNVGEDQWNSHWWELRKQYQKISEPNERTEDDFDPGAKYHVPANSQYIAYFIAHLLEFQMYRALCIEAGEYNPDGSTDPLHKCDFFNSVEAGNKLKRGLELGVSEHWQVALEAITSETTINGEAIKDYFQPLYEFLVKENSSAEEDGVNIGAIVGGVIGGLLAVAIIAYLIYYFRKKRVSK